MRKKSKHIKRYQHREVFFSNIANCIDSGIFLIAENSSMSNHFLSNKDLKETNKYIANLLDIPKEHAELISMEIDPIKISNALLSDYVKGGTLGRVSHFHWNRHHTSEVELFLKSNEYNYDADKYRKAICDLFKEIQEKTSFNESGSFFRRMKIINKVFERSYNNDRFIAPEVPMLFRSGEKTRLMNKSDEIIYT